MLSVSVEMCPSVTVGPPTRAGAVAVSRAVSCSALM